MHECLRSAPSQSYCHWPPVESKHEVGVEVMYKSSKFAAVIMGIVCMLMAIPSANGQEQSKGAKSDGAFDPVEFIKRFKTGMSYSEVLASLPKNVEQDAPAYIISQEVFLLNVSLPGAGDWSATFKFDTLDDAARRPELLIELSCSAGLSSRGESFDTIVRKVTDAFGAPINLNRSEEKFRQAGWRVSSGSMLTLEYSVAPNVAGNNVTVEFIIKKYPRRNSADAKAVA